MLNVGVDSYVDLDEAENLISSLFVSTDKAYTGWAALSSSDKEVLLRTSCRDINSLRFSGKRKSFSQKLEFPRAKETIPGFGYRLFIGQFADNGLVSSYSDSDGGLYAAKQAQVTNAVYASYFAEKTMAQTGLSISGITSKKIGPTAETYDRKSADAIDAQLGIYTRKVYSILRPWLNDSRLSI